MRTRAGKLRINKGTTLLRDKLTLKTEYSIRVYSVELKLKLPEAVFTTR